MEEVKSEIRSKVEKLTDHVEGLLKTYYRLTLVRATQKAANIGSTFLNVWLVVVLVFFMLLFGSLGLAWWLGDIMNSRTGGFLIMAGIFLLLVITLVVLRKKVLFPFTRDLIIKKTYD